MYYDQWPVLRSITDPNARALWQWSAINAPRIPRFSLKVLVKSSGVSYKLFSKLCKDGIPIAMYRKILDRLCEQGWPEACILQSSDGRVRIFKTAYVEDIDRAITHYRRREQTDIWHPSRHHRHRDDGSGA
mgnify:CR=1 FL=1